jgi:Fe-S oxidoreductase
LILENSIQPAKSSHNNSKASDDNSIGIDENNIKEAFEATAAYNCLECGKCTGICPVSLSGMDFSPRILVKKALLEFFDELWTDEGLWECLTCDLCRERCHSDVNLPEFIRRIRTESRKMGQEGLYTHNNVFSLVPRVQLKSGEKQKRLEWVAPDIKYHEKGDTLFFVGCAPYFQTIFKELEQDNTAIPQASLRLLNHLGIEPVLLESERCCGHDQFWTGDEDTFEKLMELNLEKFREAGVKKIITACPECYYMLNDTYRKYSDKFEFECVHLTELLADKLASGELKIPESANNFPEEIVSYHDPCRLGRLSSIYEPPRKLIEALPSLEFRELERNRGSSACCGVNSFINCNMNSKLWRQTKLLEAKASGASELLTSCPKCNIHLDCYVKNENVEPKIDIKIESLYVKLAEALGLMQSKDSDKS